MVNSSTGTTSAAMQRLIAECDPNERIAFSAGLLSSAVIFARLVWDQAQKNLESTGQINDGLDALLLYSLEELRAGISNLKSEPEDLAPASPNLQEVVKHALGFAVPFNDIAGKFLERFEDVFKEGSDKVS